MISSQTYAKSGLPYDKLLYMDRKCIPGHLEFLVARSMLGVEKGTFFLAIFHRVALYCRPSHWRVFISIAAIHFWRVVVVSTNLFNWLTYTEARDIVIASLRFT